MKNICFFNSNSFWGGGEKLHLDYATRLRSTRYKIVVVCAKNSPLHRKAQNVKLATYALSFKKLTLLNPLSYIQLKRIFEKEKIDTLIASDSSDMKMAGISAYLARIPKIIYLRLLASPIRNNVINRILFYKIITHAIANAEFTRAAMLKQLKEHKFKRSIKVIHHGIDLKPQVHFKEQVRSEVILGNVGRLTHEKKHEHLVELATRLKRQNIAFQLQIAGEGSLRPSLENSIEKAGVQNEVLLKGFVSNISQFLENIDIFVFCSKTEGFPFAIMEAMAAAKPVVCFDITSLSEVVKHGHTGFLVPYGNLELFVERIMCLIKNHAENMKMGKAGRLVIERHFQVEHKLQEFIDYLEV